MFYRKTRMVLSNSHVVIAGNSLSSPNGIGTPTWADYLSTRLNGTGCTFANFAVNGRTTDGLLGRQYIDADASFVTGKTNVIFFSEVTNGLANGFTLASEIDRVKTYALNRKARGFKVLLLTCYDRVQNGNPNIRTDLLAFNTWLRANYSGISDGIVECWQVPQLGNVNAFGGPDTVHPAGAFLDTLAGIAYEKLIRLPR